MAKVKLFSGKQKKGQTKLEKELAKEVKNYNARLTQALKSGRLKPEQAPERAAVKDLKAQLEGLSAKKRSDTLRKLINELKRFTAKTSKIVKTEGGLEITEYQYRQVKRLTREAEKAAEKSRQMKEKAEQKVKRIQGIPTETAQAWEDQTKISKPLQAKSWEKFKQKFQSLNKQARSLWTIYRENLTWTIEHYCYQPLVSSALALLRQISDDELAYHHAQGRNFVFINWWYVDVNRDEQLSRMTIEEFREALNLSE